MDARLSLEIFLAALGLIAGLVGVIYGLLRSEDRRLSRNLHELRNTVQELAVKVATLMSKRR